MFDSESFIALAALHQMEDWIAFLQDCKGEGYGEPEEMIAYLEVQKKLILLSIKPAGLQC